MVDYYSILGIQKNADKKTIKKANRQLALKWHPDKNPSEEAKIKFQTLSEAYAVLIDDEQRKIYDIHGKQGLERNKNGMGGINPADIFNQFFSGQGFGMGGMGGMGGMFSNTHQGKIPKGPNKQFEISLNISNMMNGVQKKISINRHIKCTTCRASGLKNGHSHSKCSVCNGKGATIRIQRRGPMISQQTIQCRPCNGTGKYVKDIYKCSTCLGKKYIKQDVIKTIDILPGTHKGDQIVLENFGDENINYNEPGDIIIIFKETIEDNMRRIGNNLYVNIPILLSDALIGLHMVYKHPNHTEIIINYNEVIKPDNQYIIYNLGFKHNDMYGDLIIHFDITFPDVLNDEHTNILRTILPIRENIRTHNASNSLKQFNINIYNHEDSKEDIEYDKMNDKMSQCTQQ